MNGRRLNHDNESLRGSRIKGYLRTYRRLQCGPQHSLRKTGATIYYIESDYDLIATQQFLGHADPSTTRRYIGLTTEQLIDYSERLANHLFSAIQSGKTEKSNRNNMLDFNLTDISDEKLIFELIKRGYAVQRQQQQKKAEIIPMPQNVKKA